MKENNLERSLHWLSLTKRLMEEQGMKKVEALLEKLSVRSEIKKNSLLPVLVSPKRAQAGGFERNWKRVG